MDPGDFFCFHEVSMGSTYRLMLYQMLRNTRCQTRNFSFSSGSNAISHSPIHPTLHPHLQTNLDYGQVQKANSRLSERLQEVKLENKSLRRTSADYAQLKQILGAEQIEATLNAAKRLKQSEKGCKQPQRSVDHGVR